MPHCAQGVEGDDITSLAFFQPGGFYSSHLKQASVELRPEGPDPGSDAMFSVIREYGQHLQDLSKTKQ